MTEPHSNSPSEDISKLRERASELFDEIPWPDQENPKQEIELLMSLQGKPCPEGHYLLDYSRLPLVYCHTCKEAYDASVIKEDGSDDQG